MKLIRSQQILAYRLLETIIFLTFFVWSASLLAENILPGFISNQLSFLKLTIFAVLTIIALSFLGRKLGLSFDIKTKKWLVMLLMIFSFIIIALSLIKFHWLAIIIITITSLFILFYFFKILFEE